MPYILSIDQGTSSTRCLLFNEVIEIVSSYQLEHEQIYRQSGWVEHDPIEIWNNVQICINKTCQVLNNSSREHKIMSIGITNQRETCLFWKKSTGQPYAPAIVWNDTRTADLCNQLIEEFKDSGGKMKYQHQTGLPISTYFSLSKVLHFFQNIPGLYEDATRGEALFGTMDSFLIWKLTNGSVHATDVTNASRTMFMNLTTLKWDESILNDNDIPLACLPKILPSSYVYGHIQSGEHELLTCVEKVPIGGVLGDQQAALFGQVCFGIGDAKCTYGTGAFLLMNTGHSIIYSTQGLLTTVGYQLSEFDKPMYALEGSIAYSGSTIQWLRDNLQVISTLAECEDLAEKVEDSGGVYFVPAFSGLYAPHWRSDARGVIVGLTAFHNKSHITRAALEATGFQVNDVLDAMKYDSHLTLLTLRVDGGQTKNSLLMQFQSDIVNVPLTCPLISETTALGACFAAGLAVQLWASLDELKRLYKPNKSWNPTMTHHTRVDRKRQWNKALNRSLDWIDPPKEHGVIDDDDDEEESNKNISGYQSIPISSLSKLKEYTIPTKDKVSFIESNDKDSSIEDIEDIVNKREQIFYEKVHVSYAVILAIGISIGLVIRRYYPLSK